MGYDVYRPVFEGGRYDVVFDTGERLLRVQCKWAPLHGDVIVVMSYSTRRPADGLIRRTYVQGEFEAWPPIALSSIGAFCFRTM